jgi:hypothetical protein
MKYTKSTLEDYNLYNEGIMRDGGARARGPDHQRNYRVGNGDGELESQASAGSKLDLERSKRGENPLQMIRNKKKGFVFAPKLKDLGSSKPRQANSNQTSNQHHFESSRSCSRISTASDRLYEHAFHKKFAL